MQSTFTIANFNLLWWGCQQTPSVFPTLTQMSPLGKQSKEYMHTVKVQGRTGCFLICLEKVMHCWKLNSYDNWLSSKQYEWKTNIICAECHSLTISLIIAPTSDVAKSDFWNIMHWHLAYGGVNLYPMRRNQIKSCFLI